jgi:hypothetical protein
MPDNRELATLFWLAVALCWVLSKPELRFGLRGIFRTLFQHPFLYLSLTGMAGYMALEVWAGARLGLWNRDLLNPTILWAVLSGGVMCFESNKAARDPRFFRTMLAETVAVGVFIEFFMNVFVMSLPAEIVTQFIIAALALMRGVAGNKPEHRQARKVFDVLFALIGFAFVAYTARRTYTDWATVDAREMTLEFILPVWLTIGLLPFTYVISLIITYDSVLRGINWAAKDRRPRWRAWFALATGLHFRHRDVNAFNRNWTKRLVEASSIMQAQTVMRSFRRERRAALQSIADAEERVRRYAGSDATDDGGRRLDQREFQETMDALRWLQAAQRNMHLNHGGRYCDDLLRMIGDDFRGLPDESGVVLKVADDGQSWYAWRRTITGWCFATGAAGPPPDLWEFDGPEPPRDFPGHDSIWGERPLAEGRNRNWQQSELEQTV